MITIQEARETTKFSSAKIQKQIEDIGFFIKQAAENGKNEILLDEAFPSNHLWNCERNGYSHPNLGSPMHIAIQKELMKYGFVIKTEPRKHMVGGGLGCMDDEGPKEETWQHYVIKW